MRINGFGRSSFKEVQEKLIKLGLSFKKQADELKVSADRREEQEEQMARGYSKLGRTSSQRKALMRDLVTDLIINEKIETTLTKAKELRRLADRMVTLGKQTTLASRRRAARLVRFEYTDEEKNEFALQKLFNTIAPRYQDRNGGYTRVLKLMPRQGDNAPMAIIEFV